MRRSRRGDRHRLDRDAARRQHDIGAGPEPGQPSKNDIPTHKGGPQKGCITVLTDALISSIMIIRSGPIVCGPVTTVTLHLSPLPLPPTPRVGQTRRCAHHGCRHTHNIFSRPDGTQPSEPVISEAF